MTKIGTSVKCDNCGETWTTNSPPLPIEYESQRVRVDRMTILLPIRVVQLHHKEGITDSHAHSIDEKDFCDIQCLFVYVNKFMRGQTDGAEKQ